MANTKKTSEMRLLIITVWMINAVLSTPVVRRDATCQDPTHHHLRSLLHPSGSSLTSFEPNLPVSTSMPSLSCPTGALQGSNLMLNQRATCPWVYVEQRNETRHPRTITQAVCYDCTGCLRGRHGKFCFLFFRMRNLPSLFPPLNKISDLFLGSSTFVRTHGNITLCYPVTYPVIF